MVLFIIITCFSYLTNKLVLAITSMLQNMYDSTLIRYNMLNTMLDYYY